MFILFPLYKEILQIPLPRISSAGDKLLWKYSNSGEFEVKTAYRILLEDYLTLSNEHHSQSNADNRVWKLIWKIKTPQKICIFVWKLLLEGLPTRQLLRNRGIMDIGLCPFCNCEEESTTHLFLLCPFARACSHGLTLAVHTSDLIGITVQQWELIVSHNLDDEVFLEYMQNIFITLWTIWYKEAYSINYGSNSRCIRSGVEHNIAAGHWQLLIKVAGARNSSAIEVLGLMKLRIFMELSNCMV